MENQGGATHEYDYTYDADGRLLKETIDPNSSSPRTLSYAYDLAGNRVAFTDSGAPSAQQYLSDTYDADGRLTAIQGAYQVSGGPVYSVSSTYDAAGNTLTTTTGSQVVTNTWDPEGHLVGVVTVGGATTQTVSYTYDDAGNRTSETVNGQTTTFLNDPTSAYDQVLEEYAPGMVLAATYVRGLDLLFQDRSAAGGGTGLSYYAVDHLGSTRALTNASGAVTDTYTYDPYGNLIASTGGTINPYQYAGQRLDAATGQYDMGARVYNASAGQFTSRDSHDGSTSDPITENHYLYAGADPVDNTDPSGHDFSSGETITVGSISAGFAAFSIGSIYVGLSLAAHLAASAAAAAPQLAPVAAALGVKVITDIQDLDRTQNYVYFAHGSSSGGWEGVTSIDVTAGKSGLDFGRGFYTFRLDDPRSIPAALARASQKQGELGGVGFVLIAAMRQGDYDGLSKVDFGTEPVQDYTHYVNSNRNQGLDYLSEFDAIIGPVGKENATGDWVPNRIYPSQYVFKTFAAGSKLKPVAILPVFN